MLFSLTLLHGSQICFPPIVLEDAVKDLLLHVEFAVEVHVLLDQLTGWFVLAILAVSKSSGSRSILSCIARPSQIHEVALQILVVVLDDVFFVCDRLANFLIFLLLLDL